MPTNQQEIDSGVPELNPVPVKSPWHHIGINSCASVSAITL